jgi:hypothetical protein
MSRFDKIAQLHDKIKQTIETREKKAFLGALLTAPVKAAFKPAKALASAAVKNPLKSLGAASVAYEVGSAGANASTRNATMKQLTRGGAPTRAITTI